MEISSVLPEPALNDHDINRIEELFQAAADLPQAEHAAYLKRECAGDDDLA